MAPVLIETAIKQEIPFISNAMVVGDGRKYLTVLLTLKCDADPKATKLSEECLAELRKLGISGDSYEKINSDERLLKAIEAGLKRANEKSISRAQHVRKFFLLGTDFSVETGEMTPTMKLKRAFTAKKHQGVIDSLYQDPKL